MSLTSHTTLIDTAIHRIGIGTWKMGGGMYPDKTPFPIYGTEEVEIAAIRYAIEQGQNHIDTAQMYGAGHTEVIVGEAIKPFNRQKLFIATKFTKSFSTRKAIIAQAHQMLARLQTSYIDLLYMHAPWQPDVSIPDCIQGMNDCIDQGLVRGIGVSNFSLEEVQLACRVSKHPISAVQNAFSLFDRSRSPAELRDFCVQNNIVFVAFRPLGGGVVPVTLQQRLDTLAKTYKCSISQLALYWVLQHQNIITIPKASKPAHIMDNLAALHLEIPSTVVDELTAMVTV